MGDPGARMEEELELSLNDQVWFTGGGILGMRNSTCEGAEA